MEKEQLKFIVEGALLAAHEPLPVKRLVALFGLDEQVDNDAIREALSELKENCAERSYELVEVGSGWRLQVREKYAAWVNKLWEEKPPKYSRATMETLALIAYRQPITRGDIEEVRGVSVSSNIIHSLLERNWVRVIGHRDVPGRPALYATTKQFLDYFNLKSLDQLPSLSELRDIESINKELFGDMISEDENKNEVESQEENQEENSSEEASSNEPVSSAEPLSTMPEDEDDEAASSMATLFLPGG